MEFIVTVLAICLGFYLEIFIYSTHNLTFHTTNLNQKVFVLLLLFLHTTNDSTLISPSEKMPSEKLILEFYILTKLYRRAFKFVCVCIRVVDFLFIYALFSLQLYRYNV